MDVKDIVKYLFSHGRRYRSRAIEKCAIVGLVAVLISSSSVCRGSAVGESGGPRGRARGELPGEAAAIGGSGRDARDDPAEARVPRSIRPTDGRAGDEAGRTFGMPFKRLQSALLPIMFKLGVMSTLIFLTFLLALKGVGIGLLLLMFKVGAAFAKFKSEWHGSHHHEGGGGGWYPHHGEVHLHVAGHPSAGEAPYHGHEAWGRVDADRAGALGAHAAYAAYAAHRGSAGSVDTPYGHYVRTGDPTAPAAAR